MKEPYKKILFSSWHKRKNYTFMNFLFKKQYFCKQYDN